MLTLRLAIKFYEAPKFEQERQRQKDDHEDDEDKGDQLPSRAGHTKSAHLSSLVLEKMKGSYTVQELTRMEQSKFYSLFF